MPRRCFSFGARQGIFFFCHGMKEYGEITADSAKARCNHLLWRAAHHNPVGFIVWIAEQSIADSAANFIGSHREGLIAGACDSCDMVDSINTGDGQSSCQEGVFSANLTRFSRFVRRGQRRSVVCLLPLLWLMYQRGRLTSRCGPIFLWPQRGL